MFNIDWLLMVRRNVPWFWRYPIRIAAIYSLISPIVIAHNEFLQYRRDTLLRLSFNGQTAILERALNMYFPNNDNAIYIADVTNDTPYTYIYDADEGQTNINIYDADEGGSGTFVYDEDEYLSDYDFIVMVPNTLNFSQTEMRAFINLYRAAGKRFLIQTY